jgi:hypothetical protein
MLHDVRKNSISSIYIQNHFGCVNGKRYGVVVNMLLQGREFPGSIPGLIGHGHYHHVAAVGKLITINCLGGGYTKQCMEGATIGLCLHAYKVVHVERLLECSEFVIKQIIIFFPFKSFSYEMVNVYALVVHCCTCPPFTFVCSRQLRCVSDAIEQNIFLSMRKI